MCCAVFNCFTAAVTRSHSLLFVVTCCHSLYHSLLLFVTLCTTCCHSLPFAVTRCHSLSLVAPLFVTRCHLLYQSLSLVVIRCHSLYHSLLFVVTRCHSLSLVVSRCTTRLSFYKRSLLRQETCIKFSIKYCLSQVFERNDVKETSAAHFFKKINWKYSSTYYTEYSQPRSQRIFSL